MKTDLELAEPHLLEWLASVGLDVEYVRGEKNTLYYRGEQGEEIPVIDFAGGYGSLMFGHNDPRIVAVARRLLDERVPVHAQFSRHPYANEVAARLNEIIRRELGVDEPYSAIFANSGAEAIEAALKHAELDRVLRLRAIAGEIEANVDAAREAVREGRARVTDGRDFEELAARVARHNAEQAARPPVFLTPEGSFHGKLVGSVQLTHNEGYRTPFSAMAAQARFVPFNDPAALRKIVADERADLLDLVVVDGVVTEVPREAPVICAFVLEPIQGEGGIRQVSEEFAREIQRVCAQIDRPVIVDEIQSGMGRSGAFLASSLIGLRGDYYAFAKSLGGGIAKNAALLVRRSQYRPEFELVHSSTFAKDAFSCHVSIEVLKLLEADGGLAYRLAAERGARLAEALRRVRADFPDVVTDVRGTGLMLGMEFRDQAGSGSQVLREQNDVLGYAIAGYLLRAHRIRIFPTASAVHTLRFEPSIHLTDDEIDRLETALRDVCEILRAQDGRRLMP